MPFIIWGSRGITSTVESGNFFCPNCNTECEYDLKQVRPFFTLFFIPIFPTGDAQRYVECAQCRQTFFERVLEPPSETDRLVGQLFGELQTGSSVQTVQAKLETMGMSNDQATALVGQMTQGQTWNCQGCGETYLKTVRKCLRCKT